MGQDLLPLDGTLAAQVSTLTLDAAPCGNSHDVAEMVAQAQAHAQAAEEEALFQEALAFEGVHSVALVAQRSNPQPPTEKAHSGSQLPREDVSRAMEIVLNDGVLLTVDLDPGDHPTADVGPKTSLPEADKRASRSSSSKSWGGFGSRRSSKF